MPCPQCAHTHYTPINEVTVACASCNTRYDAPHAPERWAPCPTHLLTHMVSTHGRVRSRLSGSILKQQAQPNEYLAVWFGTGKRVKRYVHRLVAAAFLDTPIESDCEVHHKDEDRTHNHVSNLAVLTRSQHKSIPGHSGRKRKTQDAPDYGSIFAARVLGHDSPKEPPPTPEDAL